MADFAAVLSAVTVEYQSARGLVTALHDVNAEFPLASSTAIVGRSGSGKSTLISVLSLLRRPTSGDVILGGLSVIALTDKKMAALRSREIGIVFQAYHLEASLTAAENVMLAWHFQSNAGPKRAAHRRSEEILEALGVGDLAERRPFELSGGERQRIAIGRALFSRPSMLVADEPTGNLDELTANNVAATMFSLSELFGTTVVVVTHDRVVAAQANRTLKLTQGALGLAQP